jgi:hypothetical protein
VSSGFLIRGVNVTISFGHATHCRGEELAAEIRLEDDELGTGTKLAPY